MWRYVMRKSWTILVLLSACSPSAKSADWQLLGRTTDGLSTLYFDTNSIVKSAGAVQVWVKDVNTYTGDDGVIYSVAHERLDCLNRRIGVISGASYAQNGSVVRNFDVSELKEPMADVVPDTQGDMILRRVCTA
jgi:hypothetical protein